MDCMFPDQISGIACKNKNKLSLLQLYLDDLNQAKWMVKLDD